MSTPYEKKYHKAKHLGPNGKVSALCFEKPKAIDLKKALWTLRDEAVTCEKCLKVMKGERNV